MSAALWYFAYGSNMSADVFCARRGIQPLEARRGYVDGYRLCFDIPIGSGERGVANLAAQSGARTHGVAYLLTPEQCEHLDQTEGVHMNVYRRLAVRVATPEDEPIAAFTYQSGLSDPTRKPSARYLNLILDGALAHQLPGDYVDFLESFQLAWDERIQSMGTLRRRAR
jgi:cation transport regulator ChaC